jgi:hypothetical protein
MKKSSKKEVDAVYPFQEALGLEGKLNAFTSLLMGFQLQYIIHKTAVLGERYNANDAAVLRSTQSSRNFCSKKTLNQITYTMPMSLDYTGKAYQQNPYI